MRAENMPVHPKGADGHRLGTAYIAERVAAANALIEQAFGLLPWTDPVGQVRWVHIDLVQANDYNPNAVAYQEMKLLHTSISEDGYTQPVVAIIESRVDIVLPCGHLSTLTLDTAQFLKGLCWGTAQDYLMEREASLPLKVSRIATPDGGSRSASPPATTDANSVNGSATSGPSATSTSSGDTASPMSGTSPESGTSSTSWDHVCPTCESRRVGQQKSWRRSRLSPADSVGVAGLTLSWDISERVASQPPPMPSPGFSTAARPQFDSRETSLDSDAHLVVRDRSKAIIVDGFHRYTVMRKYPDISARTADHLPLVVLDKPITGRIAATVRHNRARGKHSVTGMGSLVFQMLKEGMAPEDVCNKLGLEPTELARLTHITGYSKLYGDVEFSRPVLTSKQVSAKSKYAAAHPDEQVPSDF